MLNKCEEQTFGANLQGAVTQMVCGSAWTPHFWRSRFSSLVAGSSLHSMAVEEISLQVFHIEKQKQKVSMEDTWHLSDVFWTTALLERETE